MATSKAFFSALAILHLCMVSGYPQEVAVVMGVKEGLKSEKKIVETSDAFKVPDIPENLTSIVKETADKGLSLFNQIYDTVNTVINELTGFGRKVEDVSVNIYNSVAGGPVKNGGQASNNAVENRIEDLLAEADKEWEDGGYETSKNGPVERDVRKGIQAVRETVLNYVNLFAGKADEVQPALSQGVLDLAEETKDLQKKSKPLVDAIVKVNEVIESPEFRSFMDEMEGIGKSISKVFGEKCKWSYAREQHVNFGEYNEYNNEYPKAWVDREYVNCRLTQNGWDRDDGNLVRNLQSYTGSNFEKASYFLRYQYRGY